MGLQLGQIAPDFTADTTAGKINFHEWKKGSWTMLFSHPKDFTPICTTEFGAFARRKGEFDKRGTKVIGLSVDSVKDHEGWSVDIAKVGGTKVNFPIIADPDLKVAKQYGMYQPEADAKVTVRSVFLIDPNNKVRVILTYPPSVGRNVDEILRALDALQQTDKQKVATPVDWKPGDEVVIPPSLSDAEAKKLYPEGWRQETPYLRYVAAK
ncbi:MAG TPA: peroxiredoxin [Nevskiaceae bacterium]|nr:peroxiredoxin [Nevskiaceae bacterium]